MVEGCMTIILQYRVWMLYGNGQRHLSLCLCTCRLTAGGAGEHIAHTHSCTHPVVLRSVKFKSIMKTLHTW